MDLAESTITMERDAARRAYEDYADAVRRRHSDEDAAIAAGYKALAEGKTLISLTDVIRRGGVDERERPRLAIAPATAAWIWMARYRDGSVSYSTAQSPRRLNAAGNVTTPAATLPALEPSIVTRYELAGRWGARVHKAMVPVVPPRLRPSRAMTRYHVLFEAEWTLDPPIDPALLRHVRGDLWILIGTWDLTPLERAVLTERLAQ